MPKCKVITSKDNIYSIIFVTSGITRVRQIRVKFCGQLRGSSGVYPQKATSLVSLARSKLKKQTPLWILMQKYVFLFATCLFSFKSMLFCKWTPAGLPTLRTFPYFYGISSEFGSPTETTNLVNKLRKNDPKGLHFGKLPKFRKSSEKWPRK